jgi:ABC-type maltose transport system permease subunit
MQAGQSSLTLLLVMVMMIMMMGTTNSASISLNSSPFHIALVVPDLVFFSFLESCVAKLFAQLSFNARWIINCIVASLVTVLCCTQVSIGNLYSPEEQDLQRKQRIHMLSVINTATLWQQHSSSSLQYLEQAPWLGPESFACKVICVSASTVVCSGSPV